MQTINCYRFKSLTNALQVVAYSLGFSSLKFYLIVEDSSIIYANRNVETLGYTAYILYSVGYLLLIITDLNNGVPIA
jgi:hypothetical protein